MKDLDIIFLEGLSFISDSIRYVEKVAGNDTKWSHTGIIVSSKLFDFLAPDKWFVLESTIRTTTVDGNKLGVQISKLEDVLSRTGSHSIYALKNNPLVEAKGDSVVDLQFRLEKTKKIINDFYSKFKNKIYELTLIDMFASLFPCCYTISKCCCCCNSDSMIYCSELVIKILQHLDFIPFDINQNQSPSQLEAIIIPISNITL
jgi:hypothetical protein